MKEEKNISEVTQKLNNEEQTTNYEYAPNVNQITAAEVKEKVAGGILGAFLGTLIGAICIVLVNQFGYIASISGVVMGVCALKGYQILGKKMSLKGIIICVILWYISVTGSVMRLQLHRCIKQISYLLFSQFRNLLKKVQLRVAHIIRIC